jgi:hypothetical protein
MKTAILATAFLASLAITSPAIADETAWKEISGLAFGTIDNDESGAVTPGEFSSFGDDVFLSMDGDESGSLSLAEFYNWGFGMHEAAKDAGQTKAFKTAMRVVFALWDRNGDEQVTVEEYRQSIGFEFMRADVDQDRRLSEPEYLSGFSVVVAAHSAINPQSTDN